MQATGASHALYSWCRAQRKRQGDEHGTAVKLLRARDADDWGAGGLAEQHGEAGGLFPLWQGIGQGRPMMQDRAVPHRWEQEIGEHSALTSSDEQ